MTTLAPERDGAEPTVSEELAGFSARDLGDDRVRGQRRSLAGLLGAYALTVFVLVTLNFFLPRVMPGDPIAALVTPEAATFVHDETLRRELRSYYGLDRPLGVQYLQYLGDLATGDLGTSIRYQTPVSRLVRERLPWTVLLTGSALTLAVAAGLLAGVHSAWRRGEPVDRGLLAVFLGLRNVPVFFLASLAVFAFAVQLGWVPLAGARTLFADTGGLLGQSADVAHHLLLPAAVLATQFAAGYYLVMRANMVGELGADYLVLGRVKGLRERRLKYRYAARNALLPVVTLMALQVSHAVTGAVFVETVFAYPGMGRLLFDAVEFRDYPTLQACFLVLTLVVVTANFLADLAYRRLDPRTTR
ncbi:MAG: ABC transporter permease [Actinomycetota bacterium]|nr:ABC transporter permease [Actinomycetota bacterium]